MEENPEYAQEFEAMIAVEEEAIMSLAEAVKQVSAAATQQAHIEEEASAVSDIAAIEENNI